MPALFDYQHLVVEREIDPQGHANNVAYVQWMQDAALAHSAAQGWSGETYRRHGVSWVARSHYIEYRRPAFAGDQLIIRTWVANLQRVSSLRRYHILRAEGEELLAVAETNWAFISIRDQRLTRIPSEVSTAFEILDRPLLARGPGNGEA